MEQKRPLISVITPTYNRADFLGEAIDSMLAQTYDHFEMIIVDDGSTDDTRALVERYQSDPRIRYFYQENQGQSVARNQGIAASKGQYICFLDSDNAWLPVRLERSIEAFRQNPSADIVYADNITIDEHGQEVGRDDMSRYSGRITYHLLKDNFVSINTCIIRRYCFEAMGGFSPDDRLAEDYGLWLRFSTRYNFRYIPEFWSKYRVMDDQISSDKDKRFWSNERLLKQFLQEFPEAVTANEARRGMSFFYLRKARYEHSVGRSAKAWRAWLRAMQLYPFWHGPWRVMAVLVLKPAGRATAGH